MSDPSPPHSSSVARPVAGFVTDLRRALRLWVFDPRLPLIALTIAMLSASGVIFTSTGLKGFFLALAFVVQVATLGFLGTIRVWYLEADAGQRMPWADMRSTSRILWKRFFGLGVYAFFLMIVPIGVAVALTTASRVAGTLAFFIVALALDVALTFATVVLAFFEMPAGDAVRYSISVTRAHWPACAVYVLLAPLAIHLTFVIVPARTIGLAIMLPLQFLVALVALAIKGATVLFYADQYFRGAPIESAPPGDKGIISAGD